MPAISFAQKQVQGLVSVVMPTYRGERFIGEALASVAQQTYPNWEVIVVEDASCDATQRIVEDFARQHPWHRVDFSRNERNYGPSHSRNVAFAKAAGEFIALLDADDRWFPEHLTDSVRVLHASRKDVAYSAVIMIEDETDMLLGTYGPDARDLADFPRGLFRRNFITPSATVLRREVLADVGGWNTDMRYCEDLEFWFRSIQAGKKFQLVGGCHCLYRKNHAEAATQNNCAVHEAFAEIVDRFSRVLDVADDTRRKSASKAYRRAAKLHAAGDPLRDRSADASRSSRLMLKAWQLRPRRVDYLFRAARFRVLDAMRRHNPPVLSMPDKAPERAAA